MDKATITAYDWSSAMYAKEWGEQPPPFDMYQLLKQHFQPGATIDVGCGTGRDVAWLCSHGFDAFGVDASGGLLAQARKFHPGLRFEHAALPMLSSVKRGAYQNVLCETVLMHLEESEIAVATEALSNLLLPGGTLYLSWRISRDKPIRDLNGRLYECFGKEGVLAVLKQSATILLDQEATSLKSGKPIHRLIARRIG